MSRNGVSTPALPYAEMLDYSNVSVKRPFLQASGVPGIRHYESLRKEIIRLLRAERERRKLSNYVIAQRSGVSESMLSLIERGLRNPTMELMLRIADGIGVSLPNIIKRAIQTAVVGKTNHPVLQKHKFKTSEKA